MKETVRITPTKEVINRFLNSKGKIAKGEIKEVLSSLKEENEKEQFIKP